MNQRYLDRLRDWRTVTLRSAKSLRLAAEGEEDLVDFVAEIRGLEKQLAELRLTTSAEFDYGTHKGAGWKAKTGRRGVRTYSPAAILTTTQTAGFTLMDLTKAGVLVLNWKWSPLKQFFATNDLELRKVGHDLTEEEQHDPNGPHVGERYETTGTTYEPIDDEG